MGYKYQLSDITDFEREKLRQRLSDDLDQLHEIQKILEEALNDLNFSKKVYNQRIKAQKLVLSVEDKLKQIEQELHLKMLTLDLKEMKKLRKALKKRMISQIDPSQIKQKLVLLDEKIEEEIFRAECGISDAFKSIPLTQEELKIFFELTA